MSLSATGWDARGRGYSSGVESEAWRTFNAFNRDAWRVLEKSREVSSIYPAWFEYSILVASDLGLPNKELRRLFDEGIQRFPGYYGIYFRYARTLAPRWGGNYEVADAFIREQTTANTNPDGEALYARLYWLIDRYAGSSQDFFEKSKVDWRRMRRGFEKLTAETPYSDRNRTAFAAYACRARDAAAFAGLRPRVQPWAILEFLPRGYSLQGCDELLGNKAASN